MRKRHQRMIRAALVASDIAAALTAFAVAYAVRFHTGLFDVEAPVPTFGRYAVWLPYILVLWPAVFSVQRLYRPARGRSLIDETFSIAVGASFATLLLFGIDAYYRLYYLAAVPAGERFQFSRLFVAAFLGINLCLTVLGRALVRRRVATLRLRGYNVRRVLVAGAGDLGRRVAAQMSAHRDYGFRVVGFVDDDAAKKGLVLDGIPVLGTTGDVVGLVQQEKVDELVLALPWSAHDTMLQILDATSKEYLDVKVVPDLLEYIAFRAGLEDLDGIPVLNLSEDPLHGWDWFLKRVFDVGASGMGLLAISPLLGLLALLVRRSSPGPVFYAQERMGLDGKRFTMYKFRTMYEDAEAATGPVFAAESDPRCTPVGRWLRRFSLDELPQLWNVLRGDMSIVGPRPERPSFVREFKEKIPQYMLRHKMKSGITGWAQVNGWRGNTSISKRIEHDLYYLSNWSLALDLKIMWLTVLHVVR